MGLSGNEAPRNFHGFQWISVELQSWGFLVGYRRVHPFWRTHHIWWLFMLFNFKVSNSNVIKAVSEGLMAQIGRA